MEPQESDAGLWSDNLPRRGFGEKMSSAFGASCIFKIPVADSRALNRRTSLDEGCYCNANLDTDAGALHGEDRLACSAVGCVFTDPTVTVQIIDVDGIEAVLEMMAHRWGRKPIKP